MSIKNDFFGITALKDITVKIPLELQSENVGYETLNEEQLDEVIKFNLKSILLTHKGERMDTSFGVGIRQYLFETVTEDVYESIQSEILFQIRKYMPWLTNVNVSVYGSSNGYKLNAKIKYRLNSPEIVDFFELSVSLDEI